jgi:hypothetical protein
MWCRFFRVKSDRREYVAWSRSIFSSHRRGRQRSNALPLPDQDHRAIKRIVRPMLGFKDFDCARRLVAGIETMHMVSARLLLLQEHDLLLDAADHNQVQTNTGLSCPKRWALSVACNWLRISPSMRLAGKMKTLPAPRGELSPSVVWAGRRHRCENPQPDASETTAPSPPPTPSF